MGFALGRTWTAVADIAELVRALERSRGKLPGRDLFRGRVDREDRPVGKDPARRVRVLHGQHELDGSIGNARPLDRRRDAGPVTRELRGDRLAVGEGGAGQREAGEVARYR